MIFEWTWEDAVYNEYFDPQLVIRDGEFINEYSNDEIVGDDGSTLYIPISDYFIDTKLCKQMSEIQKNSDIFRECFRKISQHEGLNFNQFDFQNSHSDIVQLIASYVWVSTLIHQTKAEVVILYQYSIQNSEYEFELSSYIDSVADFLSSFRGEIGRAIILPIVNQDELRNIMEDINDLITNEFNVPINFYGDWNLTTRKYYIRNRLKRIPRILGSNFDDAFRFLSRLKTKYTGRSVSVNTIIKMIVNKSEFKNKLSIFENSMKSVAQKTFNCMLEYKVLQEDVNEFRRKVRKLDEFILEQTKIAKDGEINKEYKKIYRKYFDKLSRCVSYVEFCDVVKEKSKFALSGLQDRNFCNTKFNSFESNVADIVKKGFYPKDVEWCPLTGNVKRYGKGVRNPNGEYDLVLLTTAFQYFKDDSDRDKHGDDYSCCERKIFAKIEGQDLGKIRLFTRWSPCNRCKPAFYEYKGDIELYYICEKSSNYKNYCEKVYDIDISNL